MLHLDAAKTAGTRGRFAMNFALTYGNYNN